MGAHLSKVLYANAALDFALALVGKGQIEKMFSLPRDSNVSPLAHSLQYAFFMHGIIRGAAGADPQNRSIVRMAMLSYLLESLYFINSIRRGYTSFSKNVVPVVLPIAMIYFLSRQRSDRRPKLAKLSSLNQADACEGTTPMNVNKNVKTKFIEGRQPHPLDPLGVQEVQSAVNILKRVKGVCCK